MNLNGLNLLILRLYLLIRICERKKIKRKSERKERINENKR